MAWKQLKPFDLSKMGTTPGYCLQNVRLAFDVPPKYADAKSAMLANKNAGTLHDISTLPKNVAVPVFVDTASVYEHVEAADCGVFYSDGKRLTNPYNQKFFGWGETLNDVRIVEFVPDPAPTPTPTPDIKVGDKVLPIQWVDYTGTPLSKTRDFYYVSEINGDRAVLRADSMDGVVYAAMNTNNLAKVDAPAPAPTTFKVGDVVVPTRLVDYNGTPLVQYDPTYTISEINGDRAVLTARGAIWAAMNTKDIRKA